MTTDSLFRLSTHLALALACACVGVAEYDLLPETAAIAAAVIVSLAVLYRLETRVELLSVPAANRLGSYLGAATLLWGGCRLAVEYHQYVFKNTPWQFLVAAMFGVLLICAIPAKLARREKHAADYWALHAMGLVAVCLAGAISDSIAIFLLIVLYAATTAWSLALLYRRHAAEVVAASGAGRPRLCLAPTARHFALAAAVAVPLYLVTPRSPAEKLSFGQPRVEIGFNADQMTDLNQTGELKVVDQIAFEVAAEQNGRPKIDLRPDQRWQGRMLREYAKGVWSPGDGSIHLPAIDPHSTWTPNWRQPDLGPGQCTLTFSIRTNHHTHFLADPVAWAKDQSVPIADFTPDGPRAWLDLGNGTFFSDVNPINDSTVPPPYVQVWKLEKDPNLSPAFVILDLPSELEKKLKPIRENPVPRVKEYADELLEKLMQDGALPPREVCMDPVRQLPRVEYHDRIARAFTEYLAATPSLAYTTVLRRERKDVDPVEDFLYYTRCGHCERYASALALMLRSQGIPAVLILGFKGCEKTAVPGAYLVREAHAHVWVAALIQNFEPRIQGQRPISRWRSLDPYPQFTAEERDGDRANSPVSWLCSRYRTYVANFTAEDRQRALANASEWLVRGETLAVLAAVAAAALAVRAWRRRVRSRPDAPTSPQAAWLARLVEVLRGHGFVPQTGETPLEFAERVRRTLRSRPATRDAADLPIDWIAAYYEERFGEIPMETRRAAELDARLEQLRLALVRSN